MNAVLVVNEKSVANCPADVEEATAVLVVSDENGELKALVKIVLVLVVRVLLESRELPTVDWDDEEAKADVSKLWRVAELELEVEVSPDTGEAGTLEVDDSAAMDEDVDEDSRVVLNAEVIVLVEEVVSEVDRKELVAELVDDGPLLAELDDARPVLGIEEVCVSKVIDDVTNVVVEDSPVLVCDAEAEVEGEVFDDGGALLIDDPT